MIDLRHRTMGVGDAVSLVVNPSAIFGGEYVPRDILNENALIHRQLGADNAERVEMTVADWRIAGVPDFVDRDEKRVVEVKVQRPLTKANDLVQQAFFQAALYADALGFFDVEVWVYVYATGQVKKYPFKLVGEYEGAYVDFKVALMKKLQLLSELAKCDVRLRRIPEPEKTLKLVQTYEEGAGE